MNTLTDNEKAILVSVYHCHYGDNGDCIWSWAHNDSFKPHNLPNASVPGVIGSLVKKGLMHTEGSGEDASCGLTAEGQRAVVDMGAA